MELKRPYTRDEASELYDQWRAATAPLSDDDEPSQIRMSSLPALAALAHEVPHSHWLGGEYDHVYSSLLLGMPLSDDAWTAILVAGEDYRDVREFIENLSMIPLPEES